MKAKFTEGSIFRHVCVMTFASTAGLLSLFLVDLVDMYWLSLLGIVELAAAIGYAGSILFFNLSLSIGLTIACSALVSQSIGRANKPHTKRLVGNLFTINLMVVTPVTIAVFLASGQLLTWLGAEGAAADYAWQYLAIILPSFPVLALGMACSGVMRALGHAKEAMYLTLIGGAVNACLDPLLIFTAGWGIQGAAVASVLARGAMLAYGFYRVALVYGLFQPADVSSLGKDFSLFSKTAVPAVLTNLATPIGVAYVTAIMAQFGDSAVAGNTVISKLQPLAFAGLYALSGAVGPIAGQNFGAGNTARVMETLNGCVKFTLVYTLVACSLLFLLNDVLISAFQAEGDAARLIQWFCFYGLSSMFFFFGITFCTNALFNNLNLAHWATVFNFAKATLFTMPFATFGAAWGGPVGILVGLYIGSAIVATAGYLMARQRILSLNLQKQTPVVENAEQRIKKRI